jgi:hypothetical protein
VDSVTVRLQGEDLPKESFALVLCRCLLWLRFCPFRTATPVKTQFGPVALGLAGVVPAVYSLAQDSFGFRGFPPLVLVFVFSSTSVGTVEWALPFYPLLMALGPCLILFVYLVSLYLGFPPRDG